MIDMELGPIRPPSEAESLMLRVTRGCHWNKCYFVICIRNTDFQEENMKRLKKI